MILLFAHATYYPGGGIADLVGAFDTLETATAALPPGTAGIEHAHAYDTDARAVVAEWEQGSSRGHRPWDGYGYEVIGPELPKGWWPIALGDYAEKSG